MSAIGSVLELVFRQGGNISAVVTEYREIWRLWVVAYITKREVAFKSQMAYVRGECVAAELCLCTLLMFILKRLYVLTCCLCIR